MLESEAREGAQVIVTEVSDEKANLDWFGRQGEIVMITPGMGLDDPIITVRDEEGEEEDFLPEELELA